MADMSSKSAQYCAPGMTGGTGLLLLCEVELGKNFFLLLQTTRLISVPGKPTYEIPTGDYNAQREGEKIGAISTLGVGRTAPQGWTDGSTIHDSLKGVQLVRNSSSCAHFLGLPSYPVSMSSLND